MFAAWSARLRNISGSTARRAHRRSSPNIRSLPPARYRLRCTENFNDGRKTTSVKLAPRLTVTSNEAAIVAAVQGFGMTRLLSYQVAAFLASGQLKTVLNDFEPPRLPIHVLHSEGRQASAKVRTFVDSLVERLRADKALN